jgi:hypothetical protein
MLDATQVQSSQVESSQDQSEDPSQDPSPGTWLVKLPEAARIDRLAELNADLVRGTRLWLVGRFAATFCIGVAVTLAWPYSDSARTMIANASPQLGWLARPAAPDVVAADPAPQPHDTADPAPQPQDTARSELDAIQHHIDRIAASQEEITRSVAVLTAGQSQIAEEIAKVREVEQYLLYKTSYRGEETAPPRPVTARPRKPERGRHRAPAQP